MNRREFLRGGAVAAAAAVSGCVTGGGASAATGESGCPFRLGVAGYTLGGFDLDGALAELKKFGVNWFCAKQCHYPFDASPSQLKELVGKSSASGVRLYGAGPISMNSYDEARKAFDYAAALGVPTLVGVPGEKNAEGKVVSSRAMCETVAKLAEEYRIDFGIHNHGENPETGNPLLYPSVPKIWPLIADLSPRLGFCIDIAYTCADGYDACELLRRHRGRIFDVHLRNTAILGNGSSGAPADAGRIDYVRVLKTLKEIGYDRACGLELRNAYLKPSEINPGADASWIPRSLGYFRGVMAAI